MLPKKTMALGNVLAPLDTNQDGILLRETRSQKRKATSPTPQDEELDQEINILEAIHQQVEKRRENMLQLSVLQKKIDEAAQVDATHALLGLDEDKDPEILRLEEELTEKIGMTVFINNQDERGFVVVKYENLVDLDRLIRKLES